jgi:hypothetical protein
VPAPDLPRPNGAPLLSWDAGEMPLSLYGALLRAIGTAAKREGFDVFMHETTGTRTLYYRRRPRR